MKYYTLSLLGAKQKLIWQKLKTKRANFDQTLSHSLCITTKL
jgi:hypothetical protein